MAHQCECDPSPGHYEVHRDEYGSYLACGVCEGENPVPQAEHAHVMLRITNLASVEEATGREPPDAT